MSTESIHFSQTELANLRQQAYKWLDKRRVPHVRGCEEEAVKLAARWSGEQDLAAAAAILHDCTKNKTEKQHLSLMQKYGIDCDEALLAAPPLYHAVTGAAVAGEEFSMPEEICSAIRWHTTGRPDMTRLEKIIYLADYTEPTRDFEGVEELRTLSFEDTDRAMALGLEMSIENLNERGKQIFHDTMDAYNWYKNLTR